MTKHAIQPPCQPLSQPRSLARHRADSPEQVIRAWLEAFENEDTAGCASLYTHDAVLDQPGHGECKGREAVRKRLTAQMANYLDAGCEVTCAPVKIFEEGHWGILQWQDPLGLDACSIFKIHDGRIVHQQDYWDTVSHKNLYR